MDQARMMTLRCWRARGPHMAGSIARPCTSTRSIYTRETSEALAPLVKIDNASFYERYPASAAETQSGAVFKNLTFQLPTNSPQSLAQQQHWSILSPSSLARTTFLKVLSGGLICLPPLARTYPYLSSTLSAHPASAIQYIGFDADRTTPGAATRGAYLSARYESRKEETDFSLLDFLLGNTSPDPSARNRVVNQDLLEQCVRDLRLANLLTMPVGNLSNGQTRRARIAKALMAQPELLLLDGPFMGLDPPSAVLLSNVLRNLTQTCRPRMVLSLRTDDPIPEWITHLVGIGSDMTVQHIGDKTTVQQALSSPRTTPSSKPARPTFSSHIPTGEPIISITGARISYGATPILGSWQGGLHLTLHRGSRLAVLGPNGSGKTTLLSLITSDHPQTYAQPVKLFGRSRLPDRSKGEVGIGIFELQRRMGHVSPEVHAFFPRHLSVRRTLESAWADAPLARPDKLSAAHVRRVDGILHAFRDQLDPSSHRADTGNGASEPPVGNLEWATRVVFRDLSFSSQRLVLFLRALVAEQELLIFDEAFSGMDAVVRKRCYDVLDHGISAPVGPASTITGTDGESSAAEDNVDFEHVQILPPLSDKQALLLVAHDKGDVPDCVRSWMCLPEVVGKDEVQAPPRMGELPGPISAWPEAWGEIWGTS